jgi:tetratricopeptide (TPR) repeat protein
MKIKVNHRLSILFLLFITSLSFAQTAEALAKSGFEKVLAQDRIGGIEDYTQSLALKPSTDVYYKRAIAYMQTEQYAKSIKDFNKIEEARKNDFEFFFQRASCKVLMNDNKKAIADFDKAIALKPDAGKVYFARALAKIALKDKTGACVDLHKAIDTKYDKALETLYSNCK